MYLSQRIRNRSFAIYCTRARLLILSCALVAVGTCCSTLQAQTQRYWSNTTGAGKYNIHGNWSTGFRPDADDTANFDRNATYDVQWNWTTPISNPEVGYLNVTAGDVTFFNLDSSPQHEMIINGLGSEGLSIRGGATTLSLRGIHLHSLGGAQLSSGGTLRVDGTHSAGAQLSVDGFPGFAVNGNLEVDAGGIVNTGYSGQIGSIFGSYNAGSSGMATVSGPGSLWEISRDMYVGNGDATGTLNIESGGVVNNRVGYVAFNPDSTGLVNVTGFGSQWNNLSNLYLGSSSSGIGTLNIGAKGVVNSNATSNVGFGGTGIVTVSDFGSQWNINNGLLIVGNFGTGSLTIDSGGVVNASGSNIGSRLNSTGVVSVAGSNSQWNLTDDLAVGGDANTVGGTATLDIDSGGLVSVGGTTRIWSTGTVNLNGGRFEFGQTSLAEFSTINAASGSMAGNVNHSGFTNVANMTALQNTAVDLSEVKLANTGTLYGNASLGSSLANAIGGEVETVAGERMRFIAAGSTNAGEINNLGGSIRFDQEMTNQSSGFIAGRGQFTANGGWTNQGVMAFSGGPADVFGDVDNQTAGQIVTTGGANTTFFDDVMHNGTEIRTAAGSNTAFLGAYSGAGNFTGTGSVFFEGDLRPGNSPDIINFEGDVILGSGSSSLFELAGMAAGQFDRLNIDGDLYLDGALSVDLLDGFLLSNNVEFLIADVGGFLTGQFAGLNEGALVGNYGGTDLYITYGAGNGNDVALFSPVPEPGSMVVCGIGALGVVLLRRRKRTRC